MKTVAIRPAIATSRIDWARSKPIVFGHTYPRCESARPIKTSRGPTKKQLFLPLFPKSKQWRVRLLFVDPLSRCLRINMSKYGRNEAHQRAHTDGAK
ncbi:hypothetical protein AVEN_89675-1 [Araneus ventricosus]|uniref:Uncharacterized protein n=1 Tax=Araneus ventricosus TaxID=182803 RepID=A0A4Y2N790_ARAVE|nr:hypothetical protein AVEN_89675-1 [Araneus ventricosus]